MKVTTVLRTTLALISIPIAITLAALPEIYVIYMLYTTFSINTFLILIVPAFIFGYISFFLLLCLFMSQFRKIMPLVPDGVYKKFSDENIKYEVRELFYSITQSFSFFLKRAFNMPHLHRLFGAKIGKKTVTPISFPNPEHLEIGDNCMIGMRAIISGHVYLNNKLYLKKVKIGNNTTIGGQAVILPGAEIGDNCIIGLNTVIGRDKKIPSGTVWIGGKTQQLKKKSGKKKL